MIDAAILAHTKRLSAVELSTRLTEAVHRLTQFDARRIAARDELGKATAHLKGTEAALLVHDGKLPESANNDELREAQQAVATARKSLDALKDEEHQLRQLLAAFRAEQQARSQRLDAAIRQECVRKWAGREDAQIKVAREAMASAIVAYAHSQSLTPQQVDVGHFVAGVLESNFTGNGSTVSAEVQKIVTKDQADARSRILVKDKTLGA